MIAEVAHRVIVRVQGLGFRVSETWPFKDVALLQILLREYKGHLRRILREPVRGLRPQGSEYQGTNAGTLVREFRGYLGSPKPLTLNPKP